MTTRPILRDGLEDAQLVELIRTGDETALAETYRRHANAVFGLALRVTRNRALAEDVTQDVFVRLWKKTDKYDPDRGTLRTFLMTIAHSRSVDVIRSESSRRMREERDHLEVATSGPSIEEEVIDMHIAENVRKALEGLTPDERVAIELAYFGGQSYREVAVTLDQPEGTIKSRIRTGMKRLGTQLDQYQI